MGISYNLCLLALILFTTNIRSENDLISLTQSIKLRTFNKKDNLKINSNDIFFQLVYYGRVTEVIQI